MCVFFSESLCFFLGKNNDVVVSKGDSVTFICNRTAETPSQIKWRTSRFFFAYLKRNNTFTTNCTSDRVNINSNSPSELNILNVQYEDTGNYQCEIVSFEGVQMAEWNLLLKHEGKGKSSRCITDANCLIMELFNFFFRVAIFYLPGNNRFGGLSSQYRCGHLPLQVTC